MEVGYEVPTDIDGLDQNTRTDCIFPGLASILLTTLLTCTLERMLILKTDENDFKFRLCHFICVDNLLTLSKTYLLYLKYKDNNNNNTPLTKPW